MKPKIEEKKEPEKEVARVPEIEGDLLCGKSVKKGTEVPATKGDMLGKGVSNDGGGGDNGGDALGRGLSDTTGSLSGSMPGSSWFWRESRGGHMSRD